MALQKQDRNNVIHERINVLNDQGYRGFTITGVRKEWEGFRVLARSDNGLIISASGDTKEEAYSNIIDNIDQVFDEPY